MQNYMHIYYVDIYLFIHIEINYLFFIVTHYIDKKPLFFQNIVAIFNNIILSTKYKLTNQNSKKFSPQEFVLNEKQIMGNKI